MNEDLSGANLTRADLTGLLGGEFGADLSGANLSRADLSRATLSGATLDGVIAADFTGALNVPERYLKD